jgi:hypothetical protein
MFAIKITPDTMHKIGSTHTLTIRDFRSIESLFARREAVFITGYVTRGGQLMDWIVLPWYEFEESFEFDAQKIQTDWDQIVRKS